MWMNFDKFCSSAHVDCAIQIYFKDVRGWQILTIEAAETLCMVCLPPEEHIFRRKFLGNRLSKKIIFYKGLTIKFAFLRIF